MLESRPTESLLNLFFYKNLKKTWSVEMIQIPHQYFGVSYHTIISWSVSFVDSSWTADKNIDTQRMKQ